jgi:hypothetical protein
VWYVAEGEGESLGERVKAEKPDIPPDKVELCEPEFSDSMLAEEQTSQFWPDFADPIVVSSKQPGRANLLKFQINTETNSWSSSNSDECLRLKGM